MGILGPKGLESEGIVLILFKDVVNKKFLTEDGNLRRNKIGSPRLIPLDGFQDLDRLLFAIT